MLQFRIYLGDKLIATRMSRPSKWDCEQAYNPAPVIPVRFPSFNTQQRKRGRPSRAEVEAREQREQAEIELSGGEE